MIISTDIGNHLKKIQYPLMVRTLKKLEPEGNILKLLKGMNKTSKLISYLMEKN